MISGPKWPSWIRQFFTQKASLLFRKLLPFNRLYAFQASSQPSNHVLYQSGQVTFPVSIDEKLVWIKVAKSLFQFSVMKRPHWTKVAKQLFWFSLVTKPPSNIVAKTLFWFLLVTKPPWNIAAKIALPIFYCQKFENTGGQAIEGQKWPIWIDHIFRISCGVNTNYQKAKYVLFLIMPRNFIFELAIINYHCIIIPYQLPCKLISTLCT